MPQQFGPVSISHSPPSGMQSGLCFLFSGSSIDTYFATASCTSSDSSGVPSVAATTKAVSTNTPHNKF
ncbi:hypothetical protein X975_24249, partial [Stegodyphus mimosarum]